MAKRFLSFGLLLFSLTLCAKPSPKKPSAISSKAKSIGRARQWGAAMLTQSMNTRPRSWYPTLARTVLTDYSKPKYL